MLTLGPSLSPPAPSASGTAESTSKSTVIVTEAPTPRLAIVQSTIWPELAELIRSTGVTDYSIFLDEETNILFAVQKQSGCSGSQDLGENPVVRRWWEYMADIMETNPDNSPVSLPLKELFHMA